MITISLILYFLISHTIEREIDRRWDGSPALPYYQASEFSVTEERFYFYSGKYRLSGSRYFVSSNPYKALVVFFPGIGAGRNAYTKTICELAMQGYLVYAFDYTGTMSSEGRKAYGLAHVVADEEAFFAWLSRDPEAQGLPRYAIGHSWGGYAAFMSLKPNYGISKCVSIAGFDSPLRETINVVTTLPLRLVTPLLKFYYRSHFGKAGLYSGLTLLKSTSAQVLYIQGTKDTAVPFATAGKLFEKELQGHANVRFLFCEGRGHQPYLSKNAEDYINDALAKGISSPSGPEGLHLDIVRATADNPEVMKAIFDFLLS
jgi:uncharacterized protein